MAKKLKVEYVPIAKLRPFAGNPRKNDETVASIIKSIEAFGYTNPILARRENSEIIAGHTRVLALEKLGATEAPVIFLDLSETDARVYSVFDNKSVENTEWDFPKLADLLTELDGLNVDLELTGFSPEEIEDIVVGPTGHEADPQDDEVPDVPKTALTKPGDVWVLGDHRLLCGDATKGEDVRRVMGGEDVVAVVTDPPYGINQDGVPNDAPEQLRGIVSGAVECLPISDGVIAAFASTRTFTVWLDGIRAAGQVFERMLWLYKKAQCTFPWRGWILKSESILISTVGTPQWQEVKPYSHDCYELPEVSGEIDDSLGWHGSIKPMTVVTDIMQRVSPPGTNIYDPFLGSGTTLIAAEKLNRRCYGLEIEPKYCDVIVERWQNFTGQKARRADG
jgi:DNA modification methylase